jgi:hypothetical protein
MVKAIGDQRCHRWYQAWCVLIIRMHHNHNIRAGRKRHLVTGLLIAAVPAVLLMPVYDRGRK